MYGTIQNGLSRLRAESDRLTGTRLGRTARRFLSKLYGSLLARDGVQTTRAKTLLAPVPPGAKIVEIGPSYNPVAPKAGGWDTKTVDYLTREKLVERYRGRPGVEIDRIEEVDFIWTEGQLSDAVPVELHGTFDALIASHVIEHTPDLVAFFDAAAALLKSNGVVVLVIPDKRYCFDYFQPLTTTGQVVSAHSEFRSRHTGSAAFDHIAYAVQCAGSWAWSQHPVHDLGFIHTLQEAQALSAAIRASGQGDYVDLHAWHFTPASFQLVLLELAWLGQTDWQVERVTPARGCEFFAWLYRGGAAAVKSASQEEFAAKRLTLLKRTLVETKEQIGWLLNGERALSRKKRPSKESCEV